MTKRYRPANGSEGLSFENKFCSKCVHDQDEEFSCLIILNAMLYNIDEVEYPNQWVYQNGEPTCTSFQKIEGSK